MNILNVLVCLLALFLICVVVCALGVIQGMLFNIKKQGLCKGPLGKDLGPLWAQAWADKSGRAIDALMLIKTVMLILAGGVLVLTFQAIEQIFTNFGGGAHLWWAAPIVGFLVYGMYRSAFLYTFYLENPLHAQPRAWMRMVPVLLKGVYPAIFTFQFIFQKLSGRLEARAENMRLSQETLDLLAIGAFLDEAPGRISPNLMNIMRNTFRLSHLDVSDIMLPRNQIHYLDLEESPIENIDKAKRTGHTRFPLCKGGMDRCLGIIHIKDVFHFQGSLETLDFEKFQHRLIKFEEDTSLEDALKKLLKYKIHMALVVDVFGDVTGLFTLEQILEELVGSIQDEFDREDARIVPIGKYTYQVSGLTPIHELETILGMEFEEDAFVSSFGGLITTKLGRIPEKNERLELFGCKIRITDVTSRRIVTATVRVIPR